ncbi:MAG: FtsX-like permease family protein [Terrimonas sp.]|nr:FtsX-like permease family protein [Terrimonas sp.]
MHFLFAWRYFKAKKSTNAINIIAWISIVAMMIGTAALILVLSVFNGFEGLVKSLYSSFYPDIKISAQQGKVISITPEQLRQIRAVRDVAGISLTAEEKALLQNGENQSVVFLKGVDQDYPSVSGVADNMVKGSFNLGNDENPSLVLGAGVESALGIMTDRNLLPLLVYLPNKDASNFLDPLNAVRSRTATTTGTFIIQKDFDNKYAISNLAFVKDMLNLKANEYTALEVSVKDPSNADRLRDDLQNLLGTAYKVQTRYQQNQGLYSVMRAEKWVIYAVLSLILVVAAFNMIGALTMLVLEKEKDMSVLHALGGDRTFIQKIFLSEGILLAVIGGGIGMLLALLIALAQIKYKLISLGGGSFLIDYFPVKIKLTDFLLVGTTVFVIAFIAAWIPSGKAAKRDLSLRSE